VFFTHSFRNLLVEEASEPRITHSQGIFQDFKHTKVGVCLGDNSKLVPVGVGSVGRVSDVLKVDSLSHNFCLLFNLLIMVWFILWFLRKLNANFWILMVLFCLVL
jgi:hypothetical protein